MGVLQKKNSSFGLGQFANSCDIQFTVAMLAKMGPKIMKQLCPQILGLQITALSTFDTKYNLFSHIRLITSSC